MASSPMSLEDICAFRQTIMEYDCLGMEAFCPFLTKVFQSRQPGQAEAILDGASVLEKRCFKDVEMFGSCNREWSKCASGLETFDFARHDGIYFATGQALVVDDVVLYIMSNVAINGDPFLLLVGFGHNALVNYSSPFLFTDGWLTVRETWDDIALLCKLMDVSSHSINSNPFESV